MPHFWTACAHGSINWGTIPPNGWLILGSEIHFEPFILFYGEDKSNPWPFLISHNSPDRLMDA